MSNTIELLLFLLIGGKLKRYFMQVTLDELTIKEGNEDEYLREVTKLLHIQAPYMAKNGSQLLQVEEIDGRIN